MGALDFGSQHQLSEYVLCLVRVDWLWLAARSKKKSKSK